MIELNGQIAQQPLLGKINIASTAVEVSLQNKAVTPGPVEQVVEFDKGYDGLGVVTVEGDEDLTAENIRLGKTIFGIEGKFAGGYPIFGSASGEVLPVPKAQATSNVTITVTATSNAVNTTE